MIHFIMIIWRLADHYSLDQVALKTLSYTNSCLFVVHSVLHYDTDSFFTHIQLRMSEELSGFSLSSKEPE